MGAGIPVTALRRRGPLDLLALQRLSRVLRRLRPDILHSWLFFANVHAALAGRMAGVPTVVLSQRCSYEAGLSPLWRRVARWSHRRADALIVNAEATRAEELRAGADPARTFLVPNAVRVPAAPPPPRGELGLPSGPLVVALGQLAPEKGHRHLLSAWVEVRKARPDAVLVLVGEGPLRATLEAQARGLGVADAVRFLGFRSPSGPYLGTADLVAQPSLTEGMPNAVLEAMAWGRAVVATRAGGTPELVRDGETGLLVPPRDGPALAQAILHLLGDPARREAMGARARELASSLYTPETAARLTLEVYRRAGAPLPS